MADFNVLNKTNSTPRPLFDESKIRMYHAENQIEEALPILDTYNDWKSVKEFLEPRGQLHFTIVHIAAYSGRLKILKLADALEVDLYVTDDIGRCALHYAASQGQVDVVRWLVERSTNFNQLRLQDSFGRTALHLAVKMKLVSVVKLLVDARVDVNIRDNEKMSPLHLAWLNVNWNDPEQMSRYEKIVDIILGSPIFRKFIDMPVGASRTMVLNCAVRLNSIEATKQLLGRGLIVPRNPYQIRMITTALHIAANHGFHQALCILLKYRPLTFWMVNMRDELGRTPLRIALSQGQLKCAYSLVINGGSLTSTGRDGLTVVDALYRYNERPMAFLENILDSGIDFTEKHANMVTLGLQILAPNRQRQMAVISDLINGVPSMEQMDILQHPVVEAFLGLKWTRLRYFFVIIVFFRVLFVACLYVYSIVLLEKKSDCSTPRRILFVFASILQCHNTLQVIMIPKYYAKQFETWLSMISGMICIVVTVFDELRPYSILASNSSEQSDRPYRSKEPSSWVLQSISIAILFACIQVMLLIRRFPTWGCYALMFTTVLRNVLKVFLASIWIIVGFSLSFLVLFHKESNFDSPWKAFVKTVVMMMGEYEYSDLYPLAEENNSTVNHLNSDKSQVILLPITSRIIFLVFVILASIVLMNLMIGLAVTDIQELLNEGLTLRLLKQAEFVAHLEQVTSHWIFRSCVVPSCVGDMLDSTNRICTQINLGLSAKYGKRPRGISEKLVKKLFELAAKNQNLRKKFQESSSCHENEDSLTETILHLQEAVKKLQQEKMRIQRM